MDKLERYLDQVCRGIGGPMAMRRHVRQELREHLLDAVAQHQAAGLPGDDALQKALDEFGKPDEVRTELEATHGQRMNWFIDKAMQWKEMTMKAKWLWTSWAHGMLGAIIGLEALFITFNVIFIIPKFQKLMVDGIIDPAIMDDEGVRWFVNYLHTLSYVAGRHTIWLVVVPAVLWGVFEWRVQSDNKPFMRLSALGTVAVALMAVIILMSMALVISFTLGAPALGRIARPWAVEQVLALDASVTSLEQALKEKDWEAMPAKVEQALGAATRLSAGPAPTSLTAENNNAKIEEMRGRIRATRHRLDAVQQAIQQLDASKLETALREFRDVFGPIREAAKRPAP
ncbi:MAG: permease prefix domain 1-containing protein [Gemmataceae bacterium]|nr:permease prefix domain 1-containing protein [Gemmataceae bacterium]